MADTRRFLVVNDPIFGVIVEDTVRGRELRVDLRGELVSERVNDIVRFVENAIEGSQLASMIAENAEAHAAEMEKCCLNLFDKETTSADPWAHRSAGMRCGGPGTDRCIGRCRRHAPTMNGYPVVWSDDWCGDHKLDENGGGCMWWARKVASGAPAT